MSFAMNPHIPREECEKEVAGLVSVKSLVGQTQGNLPEVSSS
jgi:hypothetical protein